MWEESIYFVVYKVYMANLFPHKSHQLRVSIKNAKNDIFTSVVENHIFQS